MTAKTAKKWRPRYPVRKGFIGGMFVIMEFPKPRKKKRVGKGLRSVEGAGT